MAAKKKSRPRREYEARLHGQRLGQKLSKAGNVPLRGHAEQALSDYFTSLNGHRPAQLYTLVLREVEEPLFKAVLEYTEGNQSDAADILGINRGTLRKKLREFGLTG